MCILGRAIRSAWRWISNGSTFETGGPELVQAIIDERLQKRIARLNSQRGWRRYREWPSRLVLCGECGPSRAVRDVCQLCGGRSWASRIPRSISRNRKGADDTVN